MNRREALAALPSAVAAAALPGAAAAPVPLAPVKPPLLPGYLDPDSDHYVFPCPENERAIIALHRALSAVRAVVKAHGECDCHFCVDCWGMDMTLEFYASIIDGQLPSTPAINAAVHADDPAMLATLNKIIQERDARR